MKLIDTLRSPATPPGIYRLITRQPAASILTAITDLGWYAGYIDGSLVNDKMTFLQAAGTAFGFPNYYGRNWDAFEEMINDLYWVQASGYTLLYDSVYRFAAMQPEAWHTARSILQQATANWQREGVPFYVLLRHNWRWNRHLPKLAA